MREENATISVSENGNPTPSSVVHHFQRISGSYSSLPNRSRSSPRKKSKSLLHEIGDKSAVKGVMESNNVRNILGGSLPKLNIHLAPRQTGTTAAIHRSAGDHSFGLSTNLSTESIKNACGYHDDDFSDDDFIEVQKIPDSFQRSSQERESLKYFAANSFNKAKRLAENPLCESPSKISEEKTYANETDSPQSNYKKKCLLDDAAYVLNELDDILETHDAAPLSTSNSLETKVEDCLLDLDNYLEELDGCSITNGEDEKPEAVTILGKFAISSEFRNHTLPTNKNNAAQLAGPSEVDIIERVGFQRGNALRKTMSCAMEGSREPLQTPLKSVNSTVWRRNSIQRMGPMPLPENVCVDLIVEAKPSSIIIESPSHESELISPSTTQTDLNECNLKSLTRITLNGELRRCFSQNRVSTTNPNEMLTPDNIFQNILVQNGSNNDVTNRPRQFGRRAEGYPRILSIRSDAFGGESRSCTIVNHNQRPTSAPVVATGRFDEGNVNREQHSTLYIGSDVSSGRSSRNASPVSIISSSDSSSTSASINGNIETNLVESENQQSNDESAQQNIESGFNSQWPHSFSRTLALVCCTIGLFNMCRFAVLTIHYGGNFLLQFLLLSVIFGIPLFFLNMCLGSRIKAGPVSMWKISPICCGIGITLVLVQCFIAIYSTVAIAWLLVYLRDSFPSTAHAGYRWQEVTNPFRRVENGSNNVMVRVADYFNIIVLQRLQFIKSADSTGDIRFRISDRLAFNLTIIWTAVFLILCKGLKSFGRAVFPLTVLPLVALVAVTCKLLYVVDPSKLQNIFTAADFDEFLINSKTWTAAAQETFLTWGILGPSVISVTSRLHSSGNSKIVLRRDATLVVLITLLSLCVAALLGIACMQILNQQAYIYTPGSFEYSETSIAVYSLEGLTNTGVLSYPSKWVPHYSSFVGETYRRHLEVPHRESGYQALRFISELFPAALYLCNGTVSWIWAAVAFLSFSLLGLSQLCVMWKPISSALGNSTSSVLLCCVTALLLGIPFTTEMGLSVLHYMDLILGAAWFVPIVCTAQIFGVFLIRSRPYNGDDLVNDLKMSNSLSAFMALSWNVLLPIGLITLSIIDYKTSLSNQFYYWRGKSYFSYWSRKVAGLVQIGFLLLIPITAIVQICRYLTRGPPDILDRIQLLYRPLEGTVEIRRGVCGTDCSRDVNSRGGDANGTNPNYEAQNDAPPKYTPPPSYTTATGARITKMLRQSIRRSVRRILGDGERLRPTLAVDMEINQQSFPPEYSVSPSGSNDNDIATATYTTLEVRQRSMSLGRKTLLQKQHHPLTSTVTQRPASASRVLQRNLQIQRPFTAEDVVTVLRSSTRLRPDAVSALSRELHEIHPQHDASFRSIENLILNAEPLGQSVAIAALDADKAANNTSVI